MQRLLASVRALASDGRSASMADPLHEAEEDPAATNMNVFRSENYVDDVNTPVLPTASTTLAP